MLQVGARKEAIEQSAPMQDKQLDDDAAEQVWERQCSVGTRDVSTKLRHPRSRAGLPSVFEVSFSHRRATKLQLEEILDAACHLQLAVLAQMPMSKALPLTI